MRGKFGVKTLPILFVGVAAWATALTATRQTPGWPKVRSVERIYRSTSVDQAGFDVQIVGTNYKPLYMLRCHSGSFDGDPDFNYSGLLDCRLTSLYSKETVSTLLAESAMPTRDWENRGRFMVNHLRPGCASYPDWGRRRSFLLRGMRITLLIDMETYVDSNLVGYSFKATVVPEDKATTAIARKSPVPEPSWFFTTAPCGDR